MTCTTQWFATAHCQCHAPERGVITMPPLVAPSRQG